MRAFGYLFRLSLLRMCVFYFFLLLLTICLFTFYRVELVFFFLYLKIKFIFDWSFLNFFSNNRKLRRSNTAVKVKERQRRRIFFSYTKKHSIFVFVVVVIVTVVVVVIALALLYVSVLLLWFLSNFVIPWHRRKYSTRIIRRKTVFTSQKKNEYKKMKTFVFALNQKYFNCNRKQSEVFFFCVSISNRFS